MLFCMLWALLGSVLIALCFSWGMMKTKEDWTYAGTTHRAKDTRETGWLVFVIVFLVFLVLWAYGGY